MLTALGVLTLALQEGADVRDTQCLETVRKGIRNNSIKKWDDIPKVYQNIIVARWTSVAASLSEAMQVYEIDSRIISSALIRKFVPRSGGSDEE